MLSLMVVCFLPLLAPSPSKLSMVVMLFSIILSLTLFWEGLSSLLLNSIIISFTTGMMIMFCYCSSLTYFESKTLSQFKIKLIMMIILISVNLSDKLIFSVMSLSQEMSLMMYPLTMILLGVLVAMVSINSLTLNKKSMVFETY